MKKYIQPTVKQMSPDNEDIMLTISNTVGDEGQFLNEGLFDDDLDDNLDGDVQANELQARQKNYSSFHVWEK